MNTLMLRETKKSLDKRQHENEVWVCLWTVCEHPVTDWWPVHGAETGIVEEVMNKLNITSTKVTVATTVQEIPKNFLP